MTISLAITAVRYTPQAGITQYKWLMITTGVAGNSTKTVMVDYVAANPDTVGVGGVAGWAVVQVVGTGANAYLRTVRDNTVTDNLDQLPRF